MSGAATLDRAAISRPALAGANAAGPLFDAKVPSQGYVWWYADAISDDGKFGFSIIAMIGSVFSPYYAWSGRHSPHNHVALNVGLYGKGVKRWSMTERGVNALVQSRDQLVIGPSSLTWQGDTLEIRIQEWAVPIPRKINGVIRLHLPAITESSYQLDANGRHFWQPIGPSARAEVRFANPDLSWQGHAYLDSNWGIEPLEAGFQYWNWSRAATKDGAGIYYDAILANGDESRLALQFDKAARATVCEVPPAVELNRGPIWRMPRATPHPPNQAPPKTLQMLEATPFYTRSRIASHFDGEPVIAVHESLDLQRFSSTWVRCLLPFRMPRRSGG